MQTMIPSALLLAVLCFFSTFAMAARVQESPITFLPLSGALQDPKAEISGLAWHGERLVLLPQFPDWKTEQRRLPACLFAIRLPDLASRVHGESNAPLAYEEIAVTGLEACDALPGYEGFEAIAVRGDAAWLLIETRARGRMRGWLIQGRFTRGGTELALDGKSLLPLDTPLNLRNMSYEALSLAPQSLLAIFEANGRNVSPQPAASVFSLFKGTVANPRLVPFPHVEYRITDATDVDAANRFWAINYFWPGEKKLLAPAPDPIAQQYGRGATHMRSESVERLLCFEYHPEGVVLAKTPPVQLAQGFFPRNWEGLALCSQGGLNGFFIATDKYPGTLLGFVPLP